MYYICKSSLHEVQYVERSIENHMICDHHCHSRYEMTILLEGDITLNIQGFQQRLVKNQAIIIPPFIYHSNTSNQLGTYRRITSLFALTAVPAVLQTSSPFNGRGTPFAVFDSYAKQGEILKKCCTANDPSYYESLVDGIMAECLYQCAETQPSLPNETNETVQTMIQYIDQHLSENITLDQIANHTGHSKTLICNLFKREMGISPKQYILHKKLARANALIQSGTPLTQASLEVGYDNYSSFYRTYRKLFNTKPSNRNINQTK